MQQNLLITQENQAYMPKTDSQVFEEIMKNDIPEYVNIINESFVRIQGIKSTLDPGFINRGWEANNMNSHIRGFLKERFGKQFRTTKDNRFYLYTEHYIFLFKKLDGGKPHNKETKSSEDILEDGKLAGMLLPTIFIGYTPNNTWDKLNHISAVYISNKNIVWHLDLRKIAEGTNAKQITMFVPPLRDIDVKVKNTGEL